MQLSVAARTGDAVDDGEAEDGLCDEEERGDEGKGGARGGERAETGHGGHGKLVRSS